MQHPTDTIAAVSSPPGRSPRGLIRISGPRTRDVLDHLLKDASSEPRQLTSVRLNSPNIPALLLRFESPASYTGDDLAELQLPGSAALLDRVLHEALACPNVNARLAEPGEFTFRAYTAGKLDLTQAEGIGATIAAVSDSQLAAATLLREGKLGQQAKASVDTLGSLLALVEGGIDFTDQDDVTPITPDTLDQKLANLANELAMLLARSRSWGALEALPRVVLVGPPSTGKSTLFNALLNRERAVIDPAPGTTRDAIAEPLTLTNPQGHPVEVMLVDLAGLDESLAKDAPLPDRDAQRMAHDAIRRADLVLHVRDHDDDLPITIPCDALTIDVRSKCDCNLPHDTTALAVSAHTGKGLDVLRHAIAQALPDRAVSLQADQLALQPRHEQALRQAASTLSDARDRLAPSLSTPHLADIELLADAMRSGLNALASLGGQLTPDEVIGRVFATFCVGK